MSTAFCICKEPKNCIINGTAFSNRKFGKGLLELYKA